MDPNCPFCNLAEDEREILSTRDFFIIRDAYPVSPGHLLIITREHKRDFFALSEGEKRQLGDLITKARELILERGHSPDGYNIGMNCNRSAGQTVMHFHCHVIPRYQGDTENPRGGVRHCRPERGCYP